VEGRPVRDLWRRRHAAGRGPGRAVALVAGRRGARPGSGPTTDGARPVRSGPRLRSRSAGGAGCRAVVRYRRPAVPPGRLSGLPAIRWRRSSQPGWAWTRNCRAWIRADRRVPGQRERQGRTGLPCAWDRRCAPRAGCPQRRARRRVGRAGWRWPGRSGARAISRSRRRYLAGEPRQEPRVPPECGPAPLRLGPAHVTGCGPGPSRRGRAPARWPGQDPSRRSRAPPTWSRRVGRDRALAQRAGPTARRLALAPRPGGALPPRSRHPQPRRRHLLLRRHRLDPPPPQSLLPAPSNRWDQDPGPSGAPPPPRGPPGPAPRWGWGRW
jgi:hypothetical protein